MRDAPAQAKRHAVNLPGNHPWPPFLVVCDVGRSFELYLDWSGNGRGYGHFPDQHSCRFELHRFAEPDVQALFRAIWTDPASERAKLGAHYTPRPYVERLVQATIMDLLDADWNAVLHPADGSAIDLEACQAFHQRIAASRISFGADACKKLSRWNRE